MGRLDEIDRGVDVGILVECHEQEAVHAQERVFELGFLLKKQFDVEVSLVARYTGWDLGYMNVESLVQDE